MSSSYLGFHALRTEKVSIDNDSLSEEYLTHAPNY